MKLLLLALAVFCLLTTGILLQNCYFPSISTLSTSGETYDLNVAIPSEFLREYVYDRNKYRRKLGSKTSTGEFMSCHEYIKSLNVTFEAILIDETVLRAIDKKNCADLREWMVKLGVETKNINETILKDVTFDIIPYEDREENDYLKFQDDVVRIVLRQKTISYGNLKVPESIPVFLEMWRRSRLLECLGVEMGRGNVDHRIPEKIGVESMAILRDTILSFGMFSFLQGGSLLGWYRECSLIPHTSDIDMGVLIEDYNPQFLKALAAEETAFELFRRLGMKNESYEFTLKPRGYDINMDLFFMYSDRERSWIGGTSVSRDKIRYNFHRYDPYCAASLLGHLFWVTCRPALMLKYEYGPSWHLDHPSSKFSWMSSPANAENVGTWDESNFYRDVYWTKDQNRTLAEFLENSIND